MLLAVLAALAFLGLFRLRIDVDILNLLPSNSSVTRGLAEYQQKFLQAGEVVVVLRSPDAESALNAVTSVVASVRSRTDLIERIFWQPPANESLHDAASFLGYLWLNASTGTVLELRRSLAATNLPAVLAASRERIATSFNPSDLFLRPRDPLNFFSISEGAGETFETPERFFVSQDGRTRFIYLYSAVPLDNYEQCHAWVAEIRALLARSLTGVHPGATEFLLTGRPVFVDEISSGMRSDMSMAVPGTLLLIGLLFYLLHREWIPLLLLLSTLFVVMVWTALAGSAILGQLNVVSLGFASILLGLAEDFGIVLHQELKTHPGADAAAIRKTALPGIFWSAITTASAFALLNLSALPGLRNLGTLVALGIVIGAWAMLYAFLPLLVRFRRPQKVEEFMANDSPHRGMSRSAFAFTAAVIALGAFALSTQPPEFDPSPDALRPRNSEASAAIRILQGNIGEQRDPYWLLVHGSSADAVRRNLEKLEGHLASNAANLGIASHTLPLGVWPDPPVQGANLPVLQELAQERPRISATVLESGFNASALEISDVVFAEWSRFSPGTVSWPQGRIADWVLPKFVSRGESNLVALGLLTPGPGFDAAGVVPAELASDVVLSGWGLLGETVLQQVKREVPVISALVGMTVLGALWLTFRSLMPVLLSLSVLAFCGVLLLAAMGLLGWRWNLINLIALPLLLGMGIDYSIHTLTTLRRFGGDAARTFQSVGRALLLAGSTTIIGFAFLGMSSNAGMASLGQVCALGLTLLLLTSVFLLPAWAGRFLNRDDAARMN